jgi:F-type H+-transporting ATPase subunit gamma
MAKTQHLKRRIRSIRNTMQVTRAMKMVSAARLRRAQDRIVAARPYARRMLAVLRSLAGRAGHEAHPLLQEREVRRVDAVVISSDRGLCGSFNANILKTAAAFADRQVGHALLIHPVGRKSRDYFRRRTFDVGREWTDLLRNLNYASASEIADVVIERYTKAETDAVYVVYNEFKSAIAQTPVVERILPIADHEFDAKHAPAVEDYIYEPDAQVLFDRLLPGHVEIQIFRALLESAAAEHAARMSAMESATSNASELIDTLTLRMNRVRQASITTEIIEVVSGAQALG